jgi:hypothetical protein
MEKCQFGDGDSPPRESLVRVRYATNQVEFYLRDFIRLACHLAPHSEILLFGTLDWGEKLEDGHWEGRLDR